MHCCFLNWVVRFAFTSLFNTLSTAHTLSSLKMSLFCLIKPQFFVLEKASVIKEQNKLNWSQIYISSIKFYIQWNFVPFIYWFQIIHISLKLSQLLYYVWWIWNRRKDYSEKTLFNVHFPSAFSYIIVFWYTLQMISNLKAEYLDMDIK